MAFYPGAYVHDFGGTGACDPDSFVLHEVVANSDIPEDGSLSAVGGWVKGSKACQFYVDYDGDCEQYADSERASSHCKDGNGHRLGVETQDDKPQTSAQANAGRWTARQCERLADLIAWGNVEHGIPIRLMRTSRRADVGVGYHRLGVPKIDGGKDGWPDGELWTTSPGKPCPGDGRIAQVPGIVARAAVIAAAVKAGRCSFLDPDPFTLADALARTGGTVPSTINTDKSGELDMDETQVEAIVRRVVKAELAEYGKNPNYSAKDAATLLSTDLGTGQSLAGALAEISGKLSALVAQR
jgi:hypothetical protein